jgi:hypothetical protein
MNKKELMVQKIIVVVNKNAPDSDLTKTWLCHTLKPLENSLG